jgi:hypothetical protein
MLPQSRGRGKRPCTGHPIAPCDARQHPEPVPGERSPGGAITTGGAKAAWFKDAEGNILALIQAVPAA